MKNFFLIVCGLALAACASVLAAETANLPTEATIAQCQLKARQAEAGTNLHVYDECMAAAGLHEGGVQ